MPVKINGATSGSVTLAAPNTGGDVTVTLPGTAGTVPLVASANTWSGAQNFAGATLTGAGVDLITPTSIANSGGSASFSGGAVTFSGVSSISLNGVFSATYATYRIIISHIQSAQVAAYFRLRSSGTDVSGNVYWYGSSVGQASGGTPANNSGSGVAQFDLYGGATVGGQHVIDVSQPFAAAAKFFTWNTVISNATTTIAAPGGGASSSTSSCDGFTFYPFSGTTTGTIRVYGYRNA